MVHTKFLLIHDFPSVKDNPRIINVGAFGPLKLLPIKSFFGFALLTNISVMWFCLLGHCSANKNINLK